MSTNFYIKSYLKGYNPENCENPDWHIGKRVGAGKGKTKFLFVMTLETLEKRLKEEHIPLNLNCIVDEYGIPYSLSEFEEEIEKCDHFDNSFLGQRFT